MTITIQNHSSQNSSVERNDKTASRPECNLSVYDVVLTTLLDSFGTQINIAKMQSEVQKENAAFQEKVIDHMEKCKLQDINPKAWEKVTDKIIDHYEKHHNPTDGSWDYEPVYRYETHTKLVHPELLDPILNYNQQQIKTRQDDQADLSVLKQTGQLALVSSASTVQAATTSCATYKEVLDSISAAARKIVKMKG